MRRIENAARSPALLSGGGTWLRGKSPKRMLSAAITVERSKSDVLIRCKGITISRRESVL
jgi:hypothetical protein